MSSILYYSNFCEHSKRLLNILPKANLQKDLHFICIDKRVKDPTNHKTYVVLENVLYGEDIIKYFKPKQEAMVKQATQNNLEPSAFSFGGGGGFISSDQYSFLDMDAASLEAKGDGGMRQMHNYVDLNFSDQITTPGDEVEYKKTNKMPEGLTVEQLQQQRESELKKISGARPPMSI